MVESERIIIVAHYLLYGAAHALRDYLLSQKAKNLTCIFLPLSSQRHIFITEYKEKKQKSHKKYLREMPVNPLDYFLDIITTVRYVIAKPRFDVYLGYDALNCLSGLILRKIGKVKKVIFYSIDFVPIRFTNPLLNVIYHRIEIFCVKHADEVWNVSPRIAEGREKFLGISQEKNSQRVVPIGIWNDQIVKRPLRNVKKHQILFLGHLLEKQGVQMVLEALLIVRKKIPDIHFIIAGGGEYLEPLRQQVEKLGLQKHITFTGWITQRKDIDAMMSESAIAVATYKPEEKQLYNFTYYADPTKLKDYLGAGLPIILTDISYNAKIIAEKKCGIVVPYNKESIAAAILQMLCDPVAFKQYRKNALQYAKEFDWKQIFAKVTI